MADRFNSNHGANPSESALPEHVGLDSRSSHLRDRVDLAHELMGEGHSRIRRFLSDDGADVYGVDKKKKQEREHLNRLQLMLLDEGYKAAYDTAIRTLRDTQDTVYEALRQNSDDLHAAQQSHQDLLNRASILPDGTRVFLDKDGSAYTEHGAKLTDDQMADVDWKDNSPSWSAFNDSKDTVQRHQERNAALQEHVHRLEEIDEELRDDNNPPSKERIDDVMQELNHINRDVNGDIQNNTALRVEAPQNLPDLGL